MLERLSFRLTTEERKALQEAAETEMRDPRDQVRFILQAELTRRGLLFKSDNDPKSIKGDQFPARAGAQ